MDLVLWDCLGMKKLRLITAEIRCSIHAKGDPLKGVILTGKTFLDGEQTLSFKRETNMKKTELLPLQVYLVILLWLILFL